MIPLTERQKEYLLLFAQRNGQSKCISEAAETFQVSKPAAFSVTESLKTQGMIEKGERGEIWLTPEGWLQIQDELRHQQELMVWLTTGLGMTPARAEQEARRMAVFLAPEVLDAIIGQWRPKEAAHASDWPDKTWELPPGCYEVPFLVCKKDSREASMGDRGFQKPAELLQEENGCTLRLCAKSIQYKPERKKPLRGSLDRMWYRKDEVWYESEKDADGGYPIPGSAIRMETGPDGPVGIVRIRARASVGILGMPESEADIVFFLDQIHPKSQ